MDTLLTFDEFKLDEGLIKKYLNYAKKQAGRKITGIQTVQGHSLQSKVDRYKFHKELSTDPSLSPPLRLRSKIIAQKIEAEIKKRAGMDDYDDYDDLGDFGDSGNDDHY